MMSSPKILSKTFKNLLLKPKLSNFRPLTAQSSDWEAKEKPTHTGQEWDNDDYRLARFVGKTKLVNDNWAIKLIAATPVKECADRVVWCDGGGGPTGHPKVFINLDKPGSHACLYCGLRFKKADHH